jgi:hypothetical protein
MGSSALDFGDCRCGGTYEHRSVEVRMWGATALKDVPQGYCRNCGARVYKAHVLERIEALYRSKPPAAAERVGG